MNLPQPLQTLVSQIKPANQALVQQARERQAQLTKPAGSLGQLEEIGAQMAGVLGTVKPDPKGVAVLVAVSDHGVAQDGISAFPSSVTPAMVGNFLMDTPSGQGGAAVNAMARAIGAKVYLMDAGVNADLPEHPVLRRGAVRKGTRNLRHESSMTREEALALMQAGADLAREAIEAGADIIIPAEMGIGNTTPAAAITAKMLGVDPSEVTGRGTNIDDETLRHKVEVVRDALARGGSEASDPIGVLADLGGFDTAAMLGMMLQTAALGKIILLDGFVEGAAALIGEQLNPALRDYLFVAGECAERGHPVQLRHFGLKPMFNFGLRLGEGTGGIVAAPILIAAAAAQREMLTFEEAGVPTAVR